LKPKREKKGCRTFFGASSFGTSFNYDFTVSFTEEAQKQGIEYNYQKEPSGAFESETVSQIAATAGTDQATFTRERPGMSAFIMEDGILYHTYSSFARGLDGLWNIYQWLDRAPKGRNEPTYWMRRHDEY
jgi:predicted dithiol-disulfide oxidoreductase (DUF899 family)